MTDREMTLEIARFILEQQMKEIAFNGILERYETEGKELLRLANEGYEELLSEPFFLGRIAALKTTFDAAKPDESLIQILHKELLFGYPKHL